MKVVASAPGKAFLLGEYAVLDGAPALVAALDRRAEATFRAAPSWSVEAHYAGAHFAGAMDIGDDGRVAWREDVDAAARRALSLVPTVLDGLAAMRPACAGGLEPAHIQLDTSAFHHEGTKLGLGSSAAATVALAGAYAAWCSCSPPPLDALVALHRRFQDGRGSGADVAASLTGGVVRVQPGDDHVPMHVGRIGLPDGLALRWFWTGHAADTGDKLDALAGWRTRDPQAAASVIARLATIARTPWSDVSTFLAVTADFAAALGELDRAGQLGIFAGAHAGLRRMATAHGLVYKPCGAGGGDIGVAFGADRAALAALERQALGAGIRSLPVRPDNHGLTTTTTRAGQPC